MGCLKVSESRDMMTIKELAETLNLPRNKVAYQVSKLDSKHIVKINGINYLDKEAQLLVSEALTDKKNHIVTQEKELVDRQLKQLKEQLESKDSQITQLHRLLDQQQQLTLQSNRQIESLQLQLVQSIEEAHPVVDISKFRESLEYQDEEMEALKQKLEQQIMENELLKEEQIKYQATLNKKWWQKIFL